jgi:hypothetical protein
MPASKKPTGSQKMAATRAATKTTAATKAPATTKAPAAAKSAATSTKAGAAAAKPVDASKSPLAKAVAALNSSGVIADILTRGTPVPDVIKGKVTARDAKGATSALNTLLKIPGMEYKPIKLFPKGIPVIDEIEIQIDGKMRR